MKRLLRSLSVLVTAVLIGSSLTVVTATESEAASFRVTKLKWSPSSIDTSHDAMYEPGTTYVNYTEAKLSVKATSAKKGANVIRVTIQNSKTKKKMTELASGKNSATVTFFFPANQKTVGAWKVVKVQSVKSAKNKCQWIPGKWVGGQWIAGRDSCTYSFKTLSTAKLSKAQKKVALKVTRGKETKLTLSAPASVWASEATAKVTATLKDSSGKPVKGAKILFNKSATTLTTNAAGIAEGVIDIPQKPSTMTHFEDVALSAFYYGQAKKYVTSTSATKTIKRPRENTKFVGSLPSAATLPEGGFSQQFSVKVVSERTGKPVAKIPVQWQLSGPVPGFLGKEQLTDSNGTTTDTLILVYHSEYFRGIHRGKWEITVKGLTDSGVDLPYLPPKTFTHVMTLS